MKVMMMMMMMMMILLLLLLIIIIIIIIAVISIAPYLTEKREQVTLYQINNNVYIKTSKRISYIVIML